MSRMRRRGPASPEEIAARRVRERELAETRQAEGRAKERARAKSPGQWGISPEHLALEAANDVASIEAPGRRIQTARRHDVFDLLHSRRGLDDGQHQAARRMMRDATVRAGLQGRGEAVGRVDEDDFGKCRTDLAIDAGDRMDEVLGQVGQADALLLRAIAEHLLSPVVRPWRAVVKVATGEADEDRQTARVVGAVENLRLGYDWLDREPLESRVLRRHAARVWRQADVAAGKAAALEMVAAAEVA